MTIKVYYKRSWFGYEIRAKGMHPQTNCHVSVPDYDIDSFKSKVKHSFGTDDIEFIESVEPYFKEYYYPNETAAPGQLKTD